MHHATLRILGKDCPGIVAAVSQMLDRESCAILKSEQFTDLNHNSKCPVFYQRIVFEASTQSYSRTRMQSLDKVEGSFTINQKQNIQDQLSQLVTSFELNFATINWRDRRPRVGIMVSKYDHALWELLLRNKQGELECDIPVIISNHPTLEPIAQTFGIPFHHLPILDSSRKEHQENQVLHLLRNVYKVDTLVLARYMQILSKHFIYTFDQHRISQFHHIVNRPYDDIHMLNDPHFPPQIINIHHSFLPAFIGAQPYNQAHTRGVKLIGATVGSFIYSYDPYGNAFRFIEYQNAFDHVGTLCYRRSGCRSYY